MSHAYVDNSAVLDEGPAALDEHLLIHEMICQKTQNLLGLNDCVMTGISHQLVTTMRRGSSIVGISVGGVQDLILKIILSIMMDSDLFTATPWHCPKI